MNKLTERLVLGGAALVVGLLVGWAGRGLASYNSNMESMTSYQDWRTACPPASVKEQSCQVIEEMLDNNTRAPVVRIAITKEENKEVIGITLPLGVALEPGLKLTLGKDAALDVPFRTCSAVGCFAVMPVTDKLMASFKAAEDGKITAYGLDGKAVDIPMSFKGYSDALRAYHNGETRRSSWFWRMFS